jgi:hypothetical protein
MGLGRHPIELATPHGFLSRLVPSHEYLAVLEDTDATGDHATLRVYLPDGTIRGSFALSKNIPKEEPLNRRSLHYAALRSR